jgi:predicted transcriptional regulator of viral defense system
MYNMSMVVEIDDSPLKILRDTLRNQHGTLRASELTRLGIPRTYLSILVRNGEIERVSRGVYRETNTIGDDLYSFQARFRSAIFSHETALFLHDLSDRTPLYPSVTVPSGYHSLSLKNSGSKVFYVRRSLFALGVETMKSPQGNKIAVTGLERTVCDILRSRNQIDVQLVYDSLKRYVGKKEKNINRLYQFAQKFRIQKIVREYVEILL